MATFYAVRGKGGDYGIRKAEEDVLHGWHRCDDGTCIKPCASESAAFAAIAKAKRAEERTQREAEEERYTLPMEEAT